MQYRGTVCTILDKRRGFNATVVASVHASDDDFLVPVVQEYKKVQKNALPLALLVQDFLSREFLLFPRKPRYRSVFIVSVHCSYC
jgi:hypothetical protein